MREDNGGEGYETHLRWNEREEWFLGSALLRFDMWGTGGGFPVFTGGRNRPYGGC